MNLQSTKRHIFHKKEHPDLLSALTVIKSSFELNTEIPKERIDDLKYYTEQSNFPDQTKKRIKNVLCYITNPRYHDAKWKDLKIYALDSLYQILSKGDKYSKTIFKDSYHPKEYPYSIN